MRKICVVTGTRAEYGLLSRLIRRIDESDQTQLQLVVTNMHLSPVYGETVHEIERDGFRIDRRIPILEDGRTDALATAHSMALALDGFTRAFQELRPDLVVLLGDRYEVLAAAEAALLTLVPVAHIHGGEVTEGAYDDSIRHAVTKMSHLHFTSTEAYRKRVIQLGENPDRVFHVGALGVENIKMIQLMTKEELEHSLGFSLGGDTVLVTYHPVTLDRVSGERQITDFLNVLDAHPDLRVVFTMPNSDTGSDSLRIAIERFVTTHSDRSVSFKSLGIRRYLSLMKYAAAVVGNSSSGILEAPSLGVPTLDIGSRQKGRISADSVLHCEVSYDAINSGLKTVLSTSFRDKARHVVNPYEKEGTMERIFEIISTYPLDNILQKHFYDLCTKSIS
jgi:UDP-N-acetylglucosamine 2-epimerase (non-hydrolysing)/GDP/UDP-N,N'-diacetylbacillosamine 2-epimerase (hydrolysing)